MPFFKKRTRILFIFTLALSQASLGFAQELNTVHVERKKGSKTVLNQHTSVDFWRQKSAQEAFQEVLSAIDSAEQAEIDLVVVKGRDGSLARFPRHLITKGHVKFTTCEGRSVCLKGVTNRARIPVEALEVKRVQKIELFNHNEVFPEAKLKDRTNPAASRGEKLWVQNCLSCHGLKAPELQLKNLKLVESVFNQTHRKFSGFRLDSWDVRGIAAYLDALKP